VRTIALPFTELADSLGSSKAANIVILGTLLEASSPIGEEYVLRALKHKVKSQRWFDLDVAAMALGREELRKSACPA
jgi:Pyruvate/2-oxoacid:ferredoxin oxidoreductase gamma subunit